MKINFAQVFVNWDGAPVNNVDKNNNETNDPLTLGDLAVGALAYQKLDPMTRQPEKPIDAKEMMRRYILAAQIKDALKAGGELDLPAKDVVLIQDQIYAAHISNAFIVAQAYQMIEPEEKADAGKD